MSLKALILKPNMPKLVIVALDRSPTQCYANEIRTTFKGFYFCHTSLLVGRVAKAMLPPRASSDRKISSYKVLRTLFTQH